jgi:REP element-mobilizing transposase RayT
MDEPCLATTRRHLPHWTLPGSTYYLTFHLAKGELSVEERRIVLDHVRSGHGRFYDLAAAMVMPDHVHLILKPLASFTPSRILKGIKGVAARLLNEHRGTCGPLWQDESWDRILRDVREFDEKLQYMYDNPARRGIITAGEEYDGWYCNPDFA